MGIGFFYGGIFEVLFGLTFLIVFGMMIFILVRNIGEWNKNNHSPRLIVEAEVVSKRTNVSHHAGSQHSAGHTSTSYYVTFQVESGDRLELHLSGREYGLLAEGDKGKLTFQGTRYLGFERYL